MRNYELTDKIILQLKKKSPDNKKIILKILYSELLEEKISENDTVSFCSCEFPLSCLKNNEYNWISELIKQEVDFRSYKEFFYCPNCNRLLDEIQH